MNIFYLDKDIEMCAAHHCDKHVVKMILESLQLISTTLHVNGFDAPYKPTHINHPCAVWGQLKTILEYKCAHAGVVFEEINESYTTQTCSCCRVISISSPKGRAGLGIREWTCVECGTFHDRDINAARNILALGLERLAGGIPHYSRIAV